jgi:hypothetical protein
MNIPVIQDIKILSESNLEGPNILENSQNGDFKKTFKLSSPPTKASVLSKFDFILDRIKVKEYEERKIEELYKSKNGSRSKRWNYQKYNSPFQFRNNDGKDKLETKIQDYSSKRKVKQEIFKGVDLKKFAEEVRNTNAIDNRFLNKLKEKGRLFT